MAKEFRGRGFTTREQKELRGYAGDFVAHEVHGIDDERSERSIQRTLKRFLHTPRGSVRLAHEISGASDSADPSLKPQFEETSRRSSISVEDVEIAFAEIDSDKKEKGLRSSPMIGFVESAVESLKGQPQHLIQDELLLLVFKPAPNQTFLDLEAYAREGNVGDFIKKASKVKSNNAFRVLLLIKAIEHAVTLQKDDARNLVNLKIRLTFSVADDAVRSLSGSSVPGLRKSEVDIFLMHCFENAMQDSDRPPEENLRFLKAIDVFVGSYIEPQKKIAEKVLEAVINENQRARMISLLGAKQADCLMHHAIRFSGVSGERRAALLSTLAYTAE